MRFFASRWAGVATLAIVAAGIAGCVGTTEDPGTGAVTSGNYPNLNIKPGIAAEQITPEERSAEGQRLKAAQQAAVRSGGSAPRNRQAELDNLSRTHAKKTLDEIAKGDCSPRPTCG